MRRREFIAALGGAAAWPLVARAQQTEHTRRVGILMSTAVDGLAEFKNGLQRLSWTEGTNVAYETRITTNTDQFPALAADLVQSKVEIIVVNSAGLAAIVRDASATTPIVAAVAGDLEGAGLVASLRKPGGNVTGMQFLAPELMSKRMDLMRQLVPNLTRVGLVAPITRTGIITAHYYDVIADAAHALGIQIGHFPVHGPGEFADAFSAMVQDGDQAAVVIANPLSGTNRSEIIRSAAQYHLPTMYELRDFVFARGLISYGFNLLEGYRRAAVYVDKILRGAKAADLPIEQPTKFELVVNQQTAKALGLDIPPTLVARADEVIE
jgi:putative tryptophan/tyrosine transport system substrate-binding protein